MRGTQRYSNETKVGTVAEQRQYGVLNTDQAKHIASVYLTDAGLHKITSFGLPEVDDRYHVWRVPVLDKNSDRVGEVVIDAKTTFVDKRRTTSIVQIEARLLQRPIKSTQLQSAAGIPGGNWHNLRNVIALGEAVQVLESLPSQSIDLTFTSPPYYNARVEYKDYATYEDYLADMRLVIRACHRVLAEGRFFVMNVSPVLIRRASRAEASKRLAVPFDMHAIFVSEGFDFVDDIHWLKPEGAGWATGRGRRFAADRNPLQYKPVPVTEYVLVYRKKTDKLIDWNIRNHPDQRNVKASKIADGYDATNVWKIKPRWSKEHPAVFPLDLARKVVSYYSFVGDIVLDPFAGSGTTGEAAAELGRKFFLIEAQQKYIEIMIRDCQTWQNAASSNILYVGCRPVMDRLF